MSRLIHLCSRRRPFLMSPYLLHKCIQFLIEVFSSVWTKIQPCACIPFASQFLFFETWRRLVHAFYDTSFSFGELMKNHPHLRPDLTDCLIGNLDRDFTALFDAVSEFANIPEPLDYGRPLIKRTVSSHE